MWFFPGQQQRQKIKRLEIQVLYIQGIEYQIPAVCNFQGSLSKVGNIFLKENKSSKGHKRMHQLFSSQHQEEEVLLGRFLPTKSKACLCNWTEQPWASTDWVSDEVTTLASWPSLRLWLLSFENYVAQSAPITSSGGVYSGLFATHASPQT